MRSRAIIVLLLSAQSIFAGQLYYSPISINAAQVPSTQTDFPVLVSQTDARFKSTGNGGHVANSSGFDIRPYSDTGLTSALSYELERYNASTGEVVMWVKVGSLSSSTTPIYLGYGDTTLTTDGSSTTTWSNSFVDVYHVKDGTTLSVASATGTHNGTNHSATAAAGKVDGGSGHVSASSQYIDTSDITTGTQVTISAWVNSTTLPAAYNAAVYKNSSNSDANGLLVKSNGKVAWVLVATSQFFLDGTGSHTLSNGTWYFLVMAYDSTNGLKCYVDGASDVTAAANGNWNSAGNLPWQMGRDPANSRFWNGSLDEVRHSSVARSANWITTEYNNQSAPGTFETLGTEVAVSTASGFLLLFQD